jgi:hypothetical protein
VTEGREPARDGGTDASPGAGDEADPVGGRVGGHRHTLATAREGRQG